MDQARYTKPLRDFLKLNKREIEGIASAMRVAAKEMPGRAARAAKELADCVMDSFDYVMAEEGIVPIHIAFTNMGGLLRQFSRREFEAPEFGTVAEDARRVYEDMRKVAKESIREIRAYSMDVVLPRLVEEAKPFFGSSMTEWQIEKAATKLLAGLVGDMAEIAHYLIRKPSCDIRKVVRAARKLMDDVDYSGFDQVRLRSIDNYHLDLALRSTLIRSFFA